MGVLPRWPKGAAAPVLAEQVRGGIVESRHRGHVVQVGANGQVEHLVGDPELLVTLRSAIKPWKSSATAADVSESRFPVGSSARRIGG